MARINNLFDLNKKRIAKIFDNHKGISISYDINKPSGLIDDIISVSKKSNLYNFYVSSNFKNNNLSLKIELDEPDLDRLHNILTVVSYLLGNEIVILFKYKEFPFTDISHHYNFGNYDFSFVNNKLLITCPLESIERGLGLLKLDNSLFSILVPAMLHINTIEYADVRFFSEFSLLEYLSNHVSMSGNIFNNSDEKNQLGNFSKKILCIIEDEIDNFDKINTGIFINKIKNLLHINNLNQKGVLVDRIIEYINSFDSEYIKSHSAYVRYWNKLRSQRGLAHGNIFKKIVENQNDSQKLQIKLHQFLADLVYKEYNSYMA